MEGVIERYFPHATQSTCHSAIFQNYANECKNADLVHSTGHRAFFPTQMNGCVYADFTGSTGHSAFFNMDKVETQGTDPIMEDLIARLARCKIRTDFEAYIPPSWPIKQNMYVGMNTTQERYFENLHLLGKAWVRKVQHVARLTLNSPTGPTWPTEIEPLALKFFQHLSRFPVENIPDRADFADEIDYIWRINPEWLPEWNKKLVPLWEYVTGMARTWGWNWHNEARKRGAPEEVWRQEDRHPRTRFYQNESSKSRHHHIVAGLRVRTISQHIRTNKFYRVGDDETKCERPDSSPGCRIKCHHTEYARTLKKLKEKHGLIRAPGVEPESDCGGIE